ncbi:hypothetical protein GGI07_004696 [Coemansia sp. Benny D115]|nr:hypothetical protein GGI07_004696 [Coemansia sp. Benny D115]
MAQPQQQPAGGHGYPNYSFHGMQNVNTIVESVPDIGSIPNINTHQSGPPKSVGPNQTPAQQPQRQHNAGHRVETSSVVSVDTGTTVIQPNNPADRSGPFGPSGFPQPTQQHGTQQGYQQGYQQYPPPNQGYPSGWQGDPYAAAATPGQSGHAGPLRHYPGSEVSNYESYTPGAQTTRPGTAFPGGGQHGNQGPPPAQQQYSQYGPPQPGAGGHQRPPPPGQQQQQQPPLRPALRPALRPSQGPPQGPPPQMPGKQGSFAPTQRPPPPMNGQPTDYSSDSSSNAPYPPRPQTRFNNGRPPPSRPGTIRPEHKKNTFLNCLKESLRHIELLELVPIAGLLGASFYHHMKHRGSKNVVPFREPTWVKYLNGMVTAHNAYGMVKGGRHSGGRPYGGMRPPGVGGHGSSSLPWLPILTALAGTVLSGKHGGGGGGGGGGGHGGYGQSSYGGGGGYNGMQGQGYNNASFGGRPNAPYGHGGGGGGSGGSGGLSGLLGGLLGSAGGGGGGHGGGGGDMITKVLGKIMGSLFKGGSGGGMGTRDLESHQPTDILSTFDPSAAVQKVVAEHYYRHVYRKNMDLLQANAQTLGGAAAIRVLRREADLEAEFYTGQQSMPEEMTLDQMIMGCVLYEVEDLLARKAERGPLQPEETLENVGKIALATVIKIKMDEDRGDLYSSASAGEGTGQDWNYGQQHSLRRNQSTRQHNYQASNDYNEHQHHRSTSTHTGHGRGRHDYSYDSTVPPPSYHQSYNQYAH